MAQVDLQRWPDGKFGGSAGFAAVIRIDNKSFNDNIDKFQEANKQTQKIYSTAVERELGRVLGFSSAGTDISGEADLQGLQDSKVASLLAKAQTQELKDFLSELRTIPGGSLEVKLGKLDVGVKGEVGQLERGKASKGVRVAQRAVGKYGYSPEDIREKAKAANMSVSAYCVNKLLFGDPKFKTILTKTKNLMTLVSVDNAGKKERFFVFLKDLKPTPADFSASFERKGKDTLMFNYSTSFANKIDDLVIKSMNMVARGTLNQINQKHEQLGGGFTHFAISELTKSKTRSTTRKGPGKGVRAAGVNLPQRQRGQKRKGFMPKISESALTASVQRSLRGKMPKGPVGGPPKSGTILTYRTGEFVRSVNARLKNQIIEYFYNPVYFVHEATPRDPRKLITESIRTILQKKLGVQYRIIKRK